MPTAYHSILEVLQNWYTGNTDKFDTYHGITFLWLNRIGTLLQFAASLTIIAEIIGKERISHQSKRFALLIDLKEERQRWQDIAFTQDPVIRRGRNKRTIYTVVILAIINSSLLIIFPQLFNYLIPYNITVLVISGLMIMGFINTVKFIVTMLRVYSLGFIEILIIYPILGYLKLSEKERLFKIVSFTLLLLGFFLSFIFSY